MTSAHLCFFQTESIHLQGDPFLFALFFAFPEKLQKITSAAFPCPGRYGAWKLDYITQPESEIPVP